MTTLRISDYDMSLKLIVSDELYQEFIKQRLPEMTTLDQMRLVNKISIQLKSLSKKD